MEVDVSMNMIWGSIAAFLSGMAGSMGLGGGSVFLLYLTLFAGVEQLAAQGINLVFFLPIAALSLILYARKKLVDWKTALPIALVGFIGAVGGTLLANVLGGDMLRKVLAVGLFLLGIRELFHREKKEEQPANSEENKTSSPQDQP